MNSFGTRDYVWELEQRKPESDPKNFVHQDKNKYLLGRVLRWEKECEEHIRPIQATL